jgi:hypothetical protein
VGTPNAHQFQSSVNGIGPHQFSSLVSSPLLVLKQRTCIARSDSAQLNSIPSPITPEKRPTKRHSLNSAGTAHGRVGSPSLALGGEFSGAQPRTTRLRLRHNPAIFQDHAI